MSRSLRYTFLIHAILSVIFGLPLLLAPGRFLDLFGWLPIDPLMSRVMGAALLGFGWGSYQGWRAAGWDQVAILVEADTLFAVLATLGLARHIVVASWPWYVWGIFLIYAAFSVAWIYHLAKRPRI